MAPVVALSFVAQVRKLMLSHNQLTCATLAPVAAIEALEMLRVAQNRLEAPTSARPVKKCATRKG